MTISDPLPADGEAVVPLFAETTEQEPAAGQDLSTVYVSFSAEISTQTTESLIATLADCANNSAVEEVHLLLSTAGGNVMNGMNLYNFMRAMPFHLVTHNVGNVDSIGSSIFLGGETRYACPHSTFMFHGVGFEQVVGAPRLDERYLGELTRSLLADQRRVAALIQERTNLDATQSKRLLRDAQTKDATYALSVGIVHEIKNVAIPKGALVVAVGGTR